MVALLLLVVLAAGCGGENGEGSGAGSEPATASGGKVVRVDMKDILFVPEKVTARVGQSVRWINRDDVQHTVKATKGAGFESNTMSKGDSYSAKLTKTGTIDYVCTIHPSQRGTITVVAQ